MGMWRAIRTFLTAGYVEFREAWRWWFQQVGVTFSFVSLLLGFGAGAMLAGWLDRWTIARNEEAITRVQVDSGRFIADAQAFMATWQAQMAEEWAQSVRLEQGLQQTRDALALSDAAMAELVHDLLWAADETPATRYDLLQRVRALEQMR